MKLTYKVVAFSNRTQKTYALEWVGFERCYFEKDTHLRYMGFRKVEESEVTRESENFEEVARMMSTPQDRSTRRYVEEEAKRELERQSRNGEQEYDPNIMQFGNLDNVFQ